MNEFLQMDIFFFITSMAVVFLTACAGVAAWRFSHILKNIEHISEQVSLESDSIRDDLKEVRKEIREGKGRLKSLFSFFGKRVRKSAKNS